MEKFELKKKDVSSNFINVIKINYCDLDLLQYIDPIGYTCGVYGWNSDIYYVNSETAISTGYRPFGNIEPSRELNEKYNMLFNILKKHSYDYDIYEKKLYDMLEEFANEAIEESKH